MDTKPVSLKSFPIKVYQKAKVDAVLEGISLPEWFKRAAVEYLKRKRSARNGDN